MNFQEGFRRLTCIVSIIAFAVSIFVAKPHSLPWACASFAVPWVIFGTVTYISKIIANQCGKYKKAIFATLWISCIPASIGVWFFHSEITNLSIAQWYDWLWVPPVLMVGAIAAVWGSLAGVCLLIVGPFIWVTRGFRSNCEETTNRYTDFCSPLRPRGHSQWDKKLRKATE
ncbi:MAG: hypothetical protein ACYSR5_02900 [Planctomycetota bacterium]